MDDAAAGRRIAVASQLHPNAKEPTGVEAGVGRGEIIASSPKKKAQHPDLHLTRYRHVAIELWTHAMGGARQDNDFILAARRDRIRC